jgi:hypothetical protein
MDRDSSENKFTPRNQFLNIVYFVESAKTHSLRINLRHARWGLAFCALTCLWAVGSIAWVALLESQIRGTREHLATSLTAIFAYQVKIEKIFEVAYPSDATTNYYSESAQLPANNPIIDNKSTIDKIPKSVDDAGLETVAAATYNSNGVPAAEYVESKAKSEGNVAPATKTVAGASSETLIRISAAKAAIDGNRIALVFDITNPNSTKAEGYVWAVAKINRSGQAALFVGAPNYVKISPASGEISQISTAYRFSIRSFKRKEFEMVVPAGQAWTIGEVTIHFSDVKGTFDSKASAAVDALVTSVPSGQGSATPIKTQ